MALTEHTLQVLRRTYNDLPPFYRDWYSNDCCDENLIDESQSHFHQYLDIPGEFVTEESANNVRRFMEEMREKINARRLP